MIKETVKYPEFSEIDFIRLYCAMNFKNGCSPIIKHYELEKKLYRFYSLTEFRDLFQDICPKKRLHKFRKQLFEFGNCLECCSIS